MVRLASRSRIGVEESLLEGLDGGTRTEDQIVAKFYLGEKQPVLNAGVLSLLSGEKRREASQPFLSTVDQIVGGEGIGEFLQGLRIGTSQEGVGALLKADAALVQAQCQPVMLIETDTGGEGEIGTDPYEYLSPAGVLEVKIVLIDPTPLYLEMPAVVFSDGGHDGGGLAGFDDGHDLIGLGPSEVALHEVIPPAWGIFLDGYTPFLGAVLGPVVILRSDLAQQLPSDGIDLAIEVEKADGTLFLLKRLDGGVEQDTIEATIMESDVILVMLQKGVHDYLQCSETPEA